MPRSERLIERLRQAPKRVRYDELVRVLAALGWYQRPGGRGSHRRFDAPDGSRTLIVVEPHGDRRYVSPRAVADVLALWAAARGGQAEEDGTDG